MTLVLVALAVFSTWSNLAASAAARRVATATELLESYDRARFDLSEEESLDRTYRMQPTSEVSAAHAEVSNDLTATLDHLSAGDRTQRLGLARLQALHKTYTEGIPRVFAAVDAGNSTLAARLESSITEPARVSLEAAIYADANQQALITDATIHDLRNATRGVLFATPVAFAIGVLVLLVFLRISRNHRRTIETRTNRDALTGLPNRESFYSRGAQALLGEERSESMTSVLVIDLDRFKEVNDTLGHRFGDQLLCQIGPRISPLLRRTDTLSRLGGDEFAVLLPDSGGPAAAHQVARRLIACLREPFMLDTLRFTIDATCGHATSPQDGTDIDALLQHADVAMYVGKAAHSGAVGYDPTLDVNCPARLAILNELPAAIRDGELVLQYQPKRDIRTGRVVGAEALVRWRHPTRGLIAPDHFVPAAEHSGLIRPLTSWVIDAALTQCRHWNDGPPRPYGRAGLSVAVNVSARNLLDDNFPVEVREALDRHGVPAALLVVEVTETAIMADPPRAHAILQDLHDLGVRLSIDDFGTGYSSLSYLKLLPVDELKIDKSFVRHMNDEHNDLTIVRSVIDLAHNLGLGTVAEGIEDRITLERLAELGCDVAQGYYLAGPMNADAFDSWILAAVETPLVPTKAGH
jgi:diguanylate cyclase (GGDEF)-like protein